MGISKNRVIWVALALAWIFDLLFWKKEPGISYAIMVMLVMASGYALARSFHLKLARSVWILAGLVALFAILSIFRTETFTEIINVLGSAGLLALAAVTFLGGKWTNYSFGDYVVKGFQLFLSAISRLLLGTGKKTEEPTDEQQAEAVPPRPRSRIGWAIVRGVIIALPIVLVLAALLASADPIFSKEFAAFLKLLSIKKLTEYLFRLFYILILTYLLAGVLLHAYTQSRDEKLVGLEKPWLPPFLGWIEAVVVLAAVDLLFASFVIIQFKYFFGGSSNVHIDGYTFSEYAVKGFTELVAVAVISLVLLQVMSTITRRLDKGHAVTFSALSIGLVGLVIVMLVSAFYRLNLYETAYGFTQLRIHSHVFMIWLGILLLATAVIEALRRQRAFALAVLVCVIGFGITENVVNVDRTIARANISRALAGYPLDASYLASLTADAVPEIVKAYRSDQYSAAIHERLGAALGCKLAQYNAAEQSRKTRTLTDFWGSYNWSRTQANNLITGLTPELNDAYPIVVDKDAYTSYVQLKGEQVYCGYLGNMD